LSILDTLTVGFTTTIKKLWLMALPVAVDVFLWLGPKVSIAPVIDRLVEGFDEALALAAPGAQDQALTQMWPLLLEEMQAALSRVNLLALLSWGRIGFPSIAGNRPINPEVDQVMQVSSYGRMFVAQLSIMAVGLFLAAFFLALIAQQVSEEEFDLQHVLSRAPLYWARMATLFVPLGVMLILAVSVGLMLGPLVFLVWVGVLWFLVYTMFVPQAIVLSGDPPLRALWNSFAIVRMNFWSALGLLILTGVISMGLGLIWDGLLRSTVGTMVAIVANAYVGTALTVAMFVFYRDRLSRWHEAVQASKGTEQR
jgi:hypothetical protein